MADRDDGPSVRFHAQTVVDEAAAECPTAFDAVIARLVRQLRNDATAAGRFLYSDVTVRVVPDMRPVMWEPQAWWERLLRMPRQQVPVQHTVLVEVDTRPLLTV